MGTKGKTNTQGSGTGTGNYGDKNANFRAVRQANGNACMALANSFTKQDAGTDTQGNSVYSLIYNGPDEIPYTYKMGKDIPPVHLQVKKIFYPYTGDNSITHEKDSGSFNNGRYLQFAFKFASTYAIENEQERLKAQEELIEEAKHTKLINKLTNRSLAPIAINCIRETGKDPSTEFFK